jgi:hypothetical protein
MTLIWLIVWLIASAPPVQRWNGWLVSLLIVLFIDLFGARREL